MADEQDKQQKTEEATPQRRREARDKGQVGLSTEAVSASSLMAVAGSFLVLGGFFIEAVGALEENGPGGVGFLGHGEWDDEDGAKCGCERGVGFHSSRGGFSFSEAFRPVLISRSPQWTPLMSGLERHLRRPPPRRLSGDGII